MSNELPSTVNPAVIQVPDVQNGVVTLPTPHDHPVDAPQSMSTATPTVQQHNLPQPSPDHVDAQGVQTTQLKTGHDGQVTILNQNPAKAKPRGGRQQKKSCAFAYCNGKDPSGKPAHMVRLKKDPNFRREVLTRFGRWNPSDVEDYVNSTKELRVCSIHIKPEVLKQKGRSQSIKIDWFLPPRDDPNFVRIVGLDAHEHLGYPSTSAEVLRSTIGGSVSSRKVPMKDAEVQSEPLNILSMEIQQLQAEKVKLASDVQSLDQELQSIKSQLEAAKAQLKESK